jgi:hypothetical protein
VDDHDYWASRASQERRAEVTATSEDARKCHAQLAEAYEAKASALSERVRRPTLHIASIGRAVAG